MATRPRLRPHLLLVSAALLVLVPLLAILQYRWLGQLSEEEHDRMRANLRTAAFHFARGFNEDLIVLMRTFGRDPRGSPLGLSGETAVRIQEWEAQATHQNILGPIVYVQRSGKLHAVRVFDGTQFAPSSASLDSLVTVSRAHDPSLWIRVRVEQDYDIFLREDLEGFVVPLGGRNASREDTAYVFVGINRGYIQDRLVPQLASTTLNAGGTADYDYCIVTRDVPPRVLTSTLPDRGLIVGGEADMQAGLLMLPPMPLATAPMPRGDRPSEGGDRKPESWRGLPGRDRRGDSTELDRSNPQLGGKRGEGARFDHPGPQSGGERDERAQFDRPRPRPGEDRGDTARFERRSAGPRDDREAGPPDSRSPLELRARHRAGSLEAAVNQSRLRSLAISLGILLLMGVAVVVLLVSSYRAQRLAEQQIAFVAGVSHELRTPLAVMQSAGENLADGVVTEPVRVKAYGQLIRTEVHRLTVLAENALAYAGIHSGKQRYTLAPVNVADVVTKAVSGCKVLMMEEGVHADVRMQNPSLMVQADAGALVTAIENIITNAVKYRGGSQQIDITAEEAETEEGKEVRIAVRDHGLGIDAHDLAHIFEPFYRGKTARDGQIRGSGLGLHLANHAIRAHGGTIHAESTLGKGSLFTITLPLHSQAPVSA